MIKKFLDLGMQPLANKYLTKKDIIKKNKEQFYHLEVGFNSKTKLVSIVNTVPSKKMFDGNYPYKSSMSQTMKLSFKKLAKNLIKTYNPNSILEIGSNDGPFIRNFSKKKVICVEPCKNLAIITKRMGYKTYVSFWNMGLAKKIKSKTEKIELIYSANTLSHINNLNSVFRSIAYILSDDGILIIEEPSLLECLQKISYDQFYNEHIHVFSLLSINNLIRKYRLEIFNIEKLNTHGGSLRYYIKKVSNNKFEIHKKVKKQLNQELKYGINKYSTYIEFKNRVESSKKKLKQIFLKLKKKNKKIIGYGATAKSSTVLNYCNIKNEILEYFLDTTPNKIRKYMPGTHIPIKNYNKTLLNKVDYAFLGAWNFKEEIFKKEKQYMENGGKFITHVPIPRII